MSKKIKCPSCGIIHTVEEEPKAGTFENRVRRPTFKTGALAGSFSQQPDFTEQPTGLPNWDSHVKIPLRQAVIFGLFDAPLGVGIGLVGGASLAMLFNIGSEDSLTLWGYALFIGAGGAIGGLIAISQGAKKHWPERLAAYDALLWIEEFTGLDLNGDGEIGEPQSVLRVEIQDSNGVPRLVADFNTDQERFTELAHLILMMRQGFNEATAKQAGYSRKEWEGIRDKFIELEGATWKNSKHHEQGLELTKNGAALLQKVLPPALPTSPTSKKAPGTNARTRTNDIRQNNGFEFTER